MPKFSRKIIQINSHKLKIKRVRLGKKFRNLTVRSRERIGLDRTEKIDNRLLIKN